MPSGNLPVAVEFSVFFLEPAEHLKQHPDVSTTSKKNFHTSQKMVLTMNLV